MQAQQAGSTPAVPALANPLLVVRCFPRVSRGTLMHVFIGIAYFIIGLLQLFAIADGAQYALGVGSFFSFIIAVALTYIPIVGSVLGVYGAHNVWDWELWQAIALFFWYIPVALIFYGISLVADR